MTLAFSANVGTFAELPRTWSDVVRDLAREPNTLRMAALMKELTQVDPKMFTDASREGPGGKLKWACTPGFCSPSQSITVEGKRHKLDQE